jgi:aryl-alcohol dehydrogenase-like predicted oxidoreductase
MPDHIPSHKLALGGAQFGLKYGISPQAAQVSQNDVGKMLSLALQNGINTIDTARVYGNSETVLGELNTQPFQVVSKFLLKEGMPGASDSLQTSLQTLKRSELYAYLIHGPENLLTMPNAWNELQEEKAAGRIQKIGYSLYKPELLLELLDKGFIPDLIQIQYNILDRRFETLFPMLKKQQIEIHTRSAFLQGLFFMDELPDFLHMLRDPVKQLQGEFSSKEALTAGLLSFCVNNQYIDRVVMGVQSPSELQRNVESLISPESNPLTGFLTPTVDSEWLLPYTWLPFLQNTN